jgi:hypothetical protein
MRDSTKRALTKTLLHQTLLHQTLLHQTLLHHPALSPFCQLKKRVGKIRKMAVLPMEFSDGIGSFPVNKQSFRFDKHPFTSHNPLPAPVYHSINIDLIVNKQAVGCSCNYVE